MSWGYVAVAAATVIGGAMSAKGSRDAAKAGNKGQQAGIDWLKQVYGDSQGNFNPYIQFGQGAGGLGGLNQLASGDYSGFMNSPDYLASQKAMQYSMDHGAAARGRVFSGGFQKDLAQAQGDLAAGYLGNYRNSLMQGAQMGQNAAAQLGSIGTGTGAQIAQGYGQMGQNSAMGAIGASNAQANSLAGLASIFGDYMKTRNASSYGGGHSLGGNI